MNPPELDDPIAKEANDLENQIGEDDQRADTAKEKKDFRKRFVKSKDQRILEEEEKKQGKHHEDEMCGHYWMFSTIFPLTAATIGPIANVMSICALVYPWRVYMPPGVNEGQGSRVSDPHWVLAINGISLACGFLANFVLLLNLAKRIAPTFAQPASITLWFLSSIFLVILVILNVTKLRLYPRTEHAYSQAFYYAIISASLYFFIAILLVVNFGGALQGKYARAFNLTISQRTLMLQTMSLMMWICLGAGVFSKLENWVFLDGVYFCVVTILTVGLGDYQPTTTAGRALLFVYASIGVVTLGLVVGSIRSLVLDRAKRKVERRILQKERKSYLEDGRGNEDDDDQKQFDTMRSVQESAQKRRKCISLTSSVFCFLVLWMVGAEVFMKTEHLQGWTYFQSLYFAFTSLLTIGYGDFSPVSNSGRPFFVIWALLAIPALTILISNLGDTIVVGVKDVTLWIGEYTVLPEHRGRELHEQRQGKRKSANAPIESGSTSDSNFKDERSKHSSIHHRLAKSLVELIPHLTSPKEKQYTYDEWKFYLDLINEVDALHEIEELESSGGDVKNAGKKDWMAEDSPLMATLSESEWLVQGIVSRLEGALKEDKHL